LHLTLVFSVTHLSYIKVSFAPTYIGNFSFSNRFIEHWNSLPQKVVSTDTVNTFNNRLDCHYLRSRSFHKLYRLSSLCIPFNCLNGFTVHYVKLYCVELFPYRLLCSRLLPSVFFLHRTTRRLHDWPITIDITRS